MWTIREHACHSGQVVDGQPGMSHVPIDEAGRSIGSVDRVVRTGVPVDVVEFTRPNVSGAEWQQAQAHFPGLWIGDVRRERTEFERLAIEAHPWPSGRHLDAR